MTWPVRIYYHGKFGLQLAQATPASSLLHTQQHGIAYAATYPLPGPALSPCPFSQPHITHTSPSLTSPPYGQLTLFCWAAQVGSALFGMLCETATVHVPVRDEQGNKVEGAVPEEQPAFWHTITYRGGRREGHIGCHDEVLCTFSLLNEVGLRPPLCACVGGKFPGVACKYGW